MNNDEVVVIGTDPAPSKPTVVCVDYDCTGFLSNYAGCKLFPKISGCGLFFIEVKNTSLKPFLKALCSNLKERRVLITWDAPLTGPCLNNKGELTQKDLPGAFSQRPFEKLFMKKSLGAEWQQLPGGINIRGYGECPHWTISRHVLGLPRMGEYDTCLDKLPYRLITDCSQAIEHDKPSIVEVHPALAIWLALCGHKAKTDLDGWMYKGPKAKADNRQKLLEELLKSMSFPNGRKPTIAKQLEGCNDDQLDAFVNWFLGKAWLHSDRYCFKQAEEEISVMLVGGPSTGAMLLPWNKEFKSVNGEKFSIKAIACDYS